MKKPIEITLGVKARCKVTGWTGIVTARCEYLNGCVQYCLRPRVSKDGKAEDGIYIDSKQIEVLGPGLNVEAKPTGGPQRDAPRSAYRG